MRSVVDKGMERVENKNLLIGMRISSVVRV